MDKSTQSLQSTKVPEYIGDTDQIRYGLIIPYFESLGYEFINGDSAGDRSTDEGGISGQLEFHNPATGNRLFIEVLCEEHPPEEIFGDENSDLLRGATPQGRA